MEMEEKGEKQQQQQQGHNENNGRKTIIEIPPYEQVVQNSQPKSTPLYTSTPSFSPAFSFIKNTEFYTPPPPPPPPTSSQKIRHSDRLEAPTSSASAAQVHASSSSLNSGQTRNAILVSHRQSPVSSPSSRLPILPYQGIAEKLQTTYCFMPCGCGGRSKAFIRGYKNIYAS